MTLDFSSIYKCYAVFKILTSPKGFAFEFLIKVVEIKKTVQSCN